MKKLGNYCLICCLGGLLLFLGKCSYVHYQNDSGAKHLLESIRRIPLPDDARVIYESTEVGNYAYTGDITGRFGFRVFVSNVAHEKIEASLPIAAKDYDLHLYRLDCPLPLHPFNADSILKHISPTDRSHAYLLCAADCSPEDGLWDPRGW